MERQVATGGAARLAELVTDSEPVVALTGAGVSVPSGIPDFRTPETGLWAKVDPMEVAHIDVFERDPARFWSYYRPRFHSLGDKRPNRAHEALAELERRGLLAGVITQNIDRLHRAAGSENVVEVHGSIETVHLHQLRRLLRDRGGRRALQRRRRRRVRRIAAARSNRASSSSASCCPRRRWPGPRRWRRRPT